jgi:hypothetical protein
MASLEINPASQETKREVVGRVQARDQNGVERWMDEVIPYIRKRDDNGNWLEWVEQPRQFWEGKVYCLQTSETTFTPIMSDDVLTIVKQ